MPFDKDFLIKIATEKSIEPGTLQHAAFLAMFGTDEPNKVQICEDLHIEAGTLRGRLTEIYSKFSIRGKGPGKEHKLREKLRQLEKEHLQSSNKSEKDVSHDDISQSEGMQLAPKAKLTETNPKIDWQQASQALLNEQIQQLTTNPLTHTEGVFHRTEQVYVPLGLVRRQRQPRRGDDVPPQQGSKLYEETEIAQKFEHDEFLESVLRKRQSPKSNGKRIAIIGEPGAGKTTLLQQIGHWAFEQIDNAVVIWVSLADLQGETLESYLLDRWLRAISHQQGKIEASASLKDAFLALCQQERVWLLLDGLDEMQVSSGNSLGEIARQLSISGFLSSARLILSCRSNLWDGNRNALSGFDAYRTLDFSYPKQVETFIKSWFETLPEANIEYASTLVAALKQPGKDRIQDLVKNPLRLMLLCFNWHIGKGTLPETKADLYKQYVDDFYKWKQEQLPIEPGRRLLLNKALGKLAREAVDQEENRFRLKHEFVRKFLGSPDDKSSLFSLALDVGWINRIGFDSINVRTPVYAFSHATFEEYFASLSIDKRSFFFNHITHSPWNENAIYRVLEKKWETIYLLWLGRDDLENKEKSTLISELFSFDDQCDGYFNVQSIALAGLGLTEISQFADARKIISKLCEFSFGSLEKLSSEWRSYLDPIPEVAESALLRAPRELTVRLICQEILPDALAVSHPNKDVAKKIAQILGVIGFDNSMAIQGLLQILETSDSLYPSVVHSFCFARTAASESLIMLCNGESGHEIHHKLEQIILRKQSDDQIIEGAAKTLGKLDPHNSIVLSFFEAEIYNAKDDEDLLHTAWAIFEFNENNVLANETLSFLTQSDSNYVSSYAREILAQGATVVRDYRKLEYTETEIQEAKAYWDNSDSIFSLLREHTPDLVQKWAIVEIRTNYSKNYHYFVGGLLNNLNLKQDIWAVDLSIGLLGKIAHGDLNTLEKMIEFLINQNPISGSTPRAICELLDNSNDIKLYIFVVRKLKVFLASLKNYRDFRALQAYFVVWVCAKKLKYQDFFNAWHQ